MAEHSATRAGAPRPTTPSGLGGQQEGMYSKYCTTPTQPPSPPLSSRVRRRGDDSAVGGGVGCATEVARSGRDRLGVCHTANERSCGETGTAAATSMTAARAAAAAPRGSCRAPASARGLQAVPDRAVAGPASDQPDCNAKPVAVGPQFRGGDVQRKDWDDSTHRPISGENGRLCGLVHSGWRRETCAVGGRPEQ